MNENKKSVLSLDNESAKKFFLKRVNYFSCSLPPYYNLDYLLNHANKVLKNTRIKEKSQQIIVEKDTNNKKKNVDYSTYMNINYTFLKNKTKSSYRPMTLIHPLIYLDLVNLITKEENWEEIVRRFYFFHHVVDGKIVCNSIPFEILNQDSKLEQAINFWNSTEQETIKLSLNYQHLMKVDISNFYGTIYTHSIPWALHGEEEAKQKKKQNNLLGNELDKCFQFMNYGETVSIPQGNAVSDLIAELLLGYIDYLLFNSLKEKGVDDYKILRYRDDYRIFTNSIDDITIIKYELVELLRRHKLSLGESKTELSTDLVEGAVKADKLYWISHNPVIKLGADSIYQQPKKILNYLINRNRKKKKISIEKIIKNRVYTVSLQKHLLSIKLLSSRFPNSGQLVGALNDFEIRFQSQIKRKFIRESIDQMAILAIVMNIIYENPKITDVGIKFVSKILSSYANSKSKGFFEILATGDVTKLQNDYEEKLSVINAIHKPIYRNYSNDYLEIWLQRLVVKNLKEKNQFIDEYISNSKNQLVNLTNSIISKNEITPIFNEDWLKEKYRISYDEFISEASIHSLEDIVSDKEISLFSYDNM